MNKFQFFAVTCLFIECSYSLKTANVITKVLSCENSSHAEMINYFFSSVFSGFQSPPVCMCVQMCVGKPTYCHPSNCVKNFEKRTYEKPTQLINLSPYFPNDGELEQYDYMKEYMESHQIVEPKPGENSINTKLIRDRYNSLFSYRKTPRIDLKYFKDPVKKLERLNIERSDISKTRWPTNKFNKFFSKPPILDSQYNKQVLKNPKLMTVGIPDYNRYFYDSTKTFKRDLSKFTNLELDSKRNISFSLDNILENLLVDSNENQIDRINANHNKTEVILGNNIMNNTDNITINENENNSDNITEPHKEGKYNKEIAMVDNIGNILNELLTSISKDNDDDSTEITEPNDEEFLETSTEMTIPLYLTSTEQIVKNINVTEILNN